MQTCRQSYATPWLGYKSTQLTLGAAKLELPTLSQADLWKKSGRWETTSDEVSLMSTSIDVVIQSQ